MELTAAIVGLQALKEACEVTLYSDSKYLVDALRLGWLESWKRRGFRKADGSAVVNPDLWRALDAELARHRVEPVWVKGHADNALNNRCDELAVAAAAAAVQPDPGYREKEED
jgi:ribonuclease HI